MTHLDTDAREEIGTTWTEQERIDNQCGADWCGEQRAEGYRLCSFHQMHSFREDLEFYKDNPEILVETLELMAGLGER